ncbi:hypothetical protein J2X97_000360 [Epilithonimonas hungarica]|nr:hypothetical protein [Epilithonimonas hungarica]
MKLFKLEPPKVINSYEINDFGYALPSNGLHSQYVTFEYQEPNGYKLLSHHFNLPPGQWKFLHKEGDSFIYQSN